MVIILQSGAICLHAAAMKGHTNVVRALLQKGAAPDSKTKVKHKAKELYNTDSGN